MRCHDEATNIFLRTYMVGCALHDHVVVGCILDSIS